MSTKDDIRTQIASTPLSDESTLMHYFPPVDDSSRLTVSCRRIDYSASAVARAVEDCDAHLLNLNVTSASAMDPFGDELTLEIRISHRNAMAVARSLERYGYRVLAMEHAEGADADTMRDRYEELMRYLNV